MWLRSMIMLAAFSECSIMLLFLSSKSFFSWIPYIVTCIKKVDGEMTCMTSLLRAGVRAGGLVGSARTGCSSAEGFEDMHQVRSTHTNDIISGLLCV